MELLGKNNVFVFSFNDVLKKQSSVVNHFSHTLNIDLKELGRVNESLTMFQLALVCSLNNLDLQINGNKNRYNRRQKIVNIIREYRCEDLDSRRLDKKYFVPLLHDMVEKDVEWLSDNFDIKFTKISNKSNENIDDYLIKISPEFTDDACISLLERTIFFSVGHFIEMSLSFHRILLSHSLE